MGDELLQFGAGGTARWKLAKLGLARGLVGLDSLGLSW